MKKIKKTEDIKDILTGEVQLIKSVRYYTHMDKETYIGGIVSEIEGGLEIRLPSEQLSTLQDGQLICEVDLECDDELFPDSKFNNTIKTEFDIWIY